MVTGLVMSAAIVPLSALTSKSVSARAKQPAYLKTSASVDVETMLSRTFPFYRADSWLNTGRSGVDLRSFLLKSGLSNKFIAPVDEHGKTSVMFKGFITRKGVAREGKVNLDLRIYDQADGGTKLYEGIHEVRVIHGQYFADIQIPHSESIAKGKTVWLEAASVKEKGAAFEPRQPFAKLPEGVDAIPYYVRSVALCHTCGGDAPYTNGAFYLPTTINNGTGLDGTNVYEFGNSCSSPKEWRYDSSPRLCVGVTFQ
jgi:hypothetical protein